MITLDQTMDPHSLDIRRDGKIIGMLQWHPERSPRIELLGNAGYNYLTLNEITVILAEYKDKY